MNQRLIHNVAWSTSLTILSVFEDCIREGEHKDALDEIYIRVKAGLECFSMKSKRLEQQLNPRRRDEGV